MADDNFEDDLFADLYEDDAKPTTAAAPAKTETAPPVANGSTSLFTAPPKDNENVESANDDKQEEQEDDDDEINFNLGGTSNEQEQSEQPQEQQQQHQDHGHYSTMLPNSKEDGKMFIGGLNWETTDQSLKDYFSQFGEVLECTVMRDGASGRSRGFGFLTFKDARTVNIVMVKEHYLDGKIIDPKRAIPRDEQERTSKIFVGGVSQEATEADFKSYFMQFGKVIDATLMMDKDTGRPRGFGFVTFDSEAAVENCLNVPLEILGKPIEVKKAQPRGNVSLKEEEENRGGRFGNKYGNDNFGNQQQGGMGQMGQAPGGMTPQVMAQYWQRMQQYMQMMQQQMAMGRGAGMPGMNPMMNPMMMQQMQAMQAMQAQQQAQQQGGGHTGRSQSPMSPATGMNPAMGTNPMMGQMGGMGQNQMGLGAGGGGQVYNAYEQQQIEQAKYEQQAANPGVRQRHGSQQPQHAQQNFQVGGGFGQPTAWEGMYDDVPPPMPAGGHQGGGGGGYGKKNRGNSQQPGGPQPAPPAGAPTGPKNAGKPGANYRGGGRGGRGGFHPYQR